MYHANPTPSFFRQIFPLLCGVGLAVAIGLVFFAKAPPAKTAFEAAKIDPLVAERSGLWEITKPAPVAKHVAFEDAVIDPLAAERAGLWLIDVSAGRGHTKGG